VHLNGIGFGVVFIIICFCFMVGVLMVRKVAEIRREKDEKKWSGGMEISFFYQRLCFVNDYIHLEHYNKTKINLCLNEIVPLTLLLLLFALYTQSHK
jgi:hypothetical protein